jgi:NAD(P)-dependent dehydrogenase (short-subunit alcohol dehydrogenase family)
VAYTASKSALEAYSRALALEHAPQGIRSNCLAPAMVETAIFDKFDGDKMKEHGRHYPLGFGKPVDVAHAAIFLLSSASSWITGTTMVMDGGLLIDNKK